MHQTATRTHVEQPVRTPSPAKAARSVRHLGKVPVDLADLAIMPAVTHQQRMASINLVRRMYARRGYQTGFTDNPLDDSNRIALIAWQDARPVATLALGRDSHTGLLAEMLYPEEIARLRQPNRVICELSRLAVDPDYSSLELLRTLFDKAHGYGRTFFGATDVVVEVNPRHARYYVRECGFRQIGGIRQCPRVEAPAVLLHRSLRVFPAPHSGVPPVH